MKRIVVACAVLALPFFVAHADFSLPDFATVRDITLPAISAPEYVRVPLDRSVASGASDYRDLRVVREPSKTEVPYQLVVEDASVTSAYAPSRVMDTVTDKSGRLMFILDLGQPGVLHSRLGIETASKNYRRQVSVYGASQLFSHESASWNLLTDKGYIFKFSDDTAGYVTAKGDVSYPESSVRYLRVVVEGGTEGPLTFSSAGVYRYNVSVAREAVEEARAEVNDVKGEQATEVIADLGVSGIPTKQIELSVKTSGNFSRSAVLYGGNDGQTWSRVSQGYLSQIETPKFTGSSATISYPESEYRYYKVRVENFDDAPLQIDPRARFTGILRTIVFEAEPGATYALYYGNKNAYAPKYDLARYFAYLDTAGLTEGSLGAVRENSEYIAPTAPVVPFTERNKLLLNVTLALLVVLIALFVFWYIWRHTRTHKDAGVNVSASPSPSIPEQVVPPQQTDLPPSSQ